jgi:hypothetical protein
MVTIFRVNEVEGGYINLEMKVRVGTQNVVLFIGYHHAPHPYPYSHCERL